MALFVKLVFDDRRHQAAERCETLRQAAEAAFRLADEFGRRCDEPRRPRWINVYEDEHLELSVQVLDAAMREQPRRQAGASR